MKEILVSLAKLLATDDAFNLAFSSLATDGEKYELAKTKFTDLTREDFSDFLEELDNSEKASLADLSADELALVAGGAGGLATKLAATAMLVTVFGSGGVLRHGDVSTPGTWRVAFASSDADPVMRGSGGSGVAASCVDSRAVWGAWSSSLRSDPTMATAAELVAQAVLPRLSPLGLGQSLSDGAALAASAAQFASSVSCGARVAAHYARPLDLKPTVGNLDHVVSGGAGAWRQAGGRWLLASETAGCHCPDVVHKFGYGTDIVAGSGGFGSVRLSLGSTEVTKTLFPDTWTAATIAAACVLTVRFGACVPSGARDVYYLRVAGSETVALKAVVGRARNKTAYVASFYPVLVSEAAVLHSSVLPSRFGADRETRFGSFLNSAPKLQRNGDGSFSLLSGR